MKPSRPSWDSASSAAWPPRPGQRHLQRARGRPSTLQRSSRSPGRRAEWPVMTDGPDRWHRWLLDLRFGGDAAYREKNLTEYLYPVRDTVLDKAHLRPGDSLLDVGTGDGIIAVDSLELLVPLKDKATALREFYWVFKPGGRVSLSEPINVLMSAADPDLFFGNDVTPVRALAAKVEALYDSIPPHGGDPMGDFDERDLVRHAKDAGFPEINLELQVSVKAHKH